MNALETAMLYREAGAVSRYHTVRTLRQQDLSSHSHNVAMLVHLLYPECRKELLLACMYHDLPELVTGDIPAPAKRASVKLGLLLEEMEKGTAPLHQDFGLTPFEEAVLKWCDTFELVLFCTEEMLMGNSYALAPLRKGLSWCESYPLVLDHTMVGPTAKSLLTSVRAATTPKEKNHESQ